jgi:hypothetical protein
MATLNINQGSTYIARLTGMNSAGGYYDLTGYTASGYIKYRYSDSDYFLNLNPVVHPSYISGLIDITIPATETASLPVTQLLFDINVYSGVSVSRVLGGKVVVNPEVTY